MALSKQNAAMNLPEQAPGPEQPNALTPRRSDSLLREAHVNFEQNFLKERQRQKAKGQQKDIER